MFKTNLVRKSDRKIIGTYLVKGNPSMKELSDVLGEISIGGLDCVSGFESQNWAVEHVSNGGELDCEWGEVKVAGPVESFTAQLRELKAKVAFEKGLEPSDLHFNFVREKRSRSWRTRSAPKQFYTTISQGYHANDKVINLRKDGSFDREGAINAFRAQAGVLARMQADRKKSERQTAMRETNSDLTDRIKALAVSHGLSIKYDAPDAEGRVNIEPSHQYSRDFKATGLTESQAAAVINLFAELKATIAQFHTDNED